MLHCLCHNVLFVSRLVRCCQLSDVIAPSIRRIDKMMKMWISLWWQLLHAFTADNLCVFIRWFLWCVDLNRLIICIGFFDFVPSLCLYCVVTTTCSAPSVILYHFGDVNYRICLIRRHFDVIFASIDQFSNSFFSEVEQIFLCKWIKTWSAVCCCAALWKLKLGNAVDVSLVLSWLVNACMNVSI